MTDMKHIPIALSLLLSACSIQPPPVSSVPDAAEVDMATRIVAESLSDQNDGAIAALTDALTLVGPTGMVRLTGTGLPDTAGTSGRGLETGFTYSFQADSAIHQAQFSRSVVKPGYGKSVTVRTRHRYVEPGGVLDGMLFDGVRSGIITTDLTSSTFSRTDQWTVTGLSPSSATMSIDGWHRGEGTLGNVRYTIDIRFLNIAIDRTLARATKSLSQGVTGTMTYAVRMERADVASPLVKTLNGTVEFRGDGTALMRYGTVADAPRTLSVNTGKPLDDDEFEGVVDRIEGLHIVLTNGERIEIPTDSVIDPDGDYTTLADVSTAVANGVRVKAEGDLTAGSTTTNRVASLVEFESDSDDGDDDDDDDDTSDDEEDDDD
jgi:hypothetical protein